jgi:2-aminoethylphosphonate transport system ATP-binding protein
VVQQYALFPHMRVEDNVAFGLRAQKVARGESRGRVAEALEMTGMAAYAGAVRGNCPAGSSWGYPPGP